MLLRLAALLLALPLAAQAQTDTATPRSGWQSFTPPEGHLTALFPVPPQRQEDITADGPGKGAKNTVLFSVAAPTIYMIAWSEYPAGIAIDPEGEINANRDNFIKGLKATLGTSSPHRLGSIQGIEFTATRPEAAAGPDGQPQPALSIRGRVYMQGRRPVMTGVVTSPANAASPDVLRFLNGLSLK